MEKTYMKSNFFNYDNYIAMMDKIGEETKKGNEDADDDLSFMKEIMDSFFNYVNVVDGAEIRIRNAYFRYENEELRDTIMAIDNNRRIAHEAAIMNVNLINRIAHSYGIDKIFIGDVNDRYQVADFCLEVTIEIFKHRKL